MKPITMLTLFFKAVGLLFNFGSLFYFGYFLVTLFITRAELAADKPITTDFMSGGLNALYTALGYGAFGGSLNLCAPLFARLTTWGAKE
jgi:hypothetical protein